MIRILQSGLRWIPMLLVNHGTWAHAEVVADRNSNTIVTQVNGRDFTITGGEQAGQNLFHSFSNFSVPEGTAAIFNTGNVQNIFGRVTDNNISRIDGIIRSTSGANLFLLNPSGILFGPNAKLEVNGSFIATTAEQIKFVDGTIFSARPTSAPLLTITAPIGLQFGTQAAPIDNRSIAGLQVAPGKTLGILGGNVTLESGKLTAFGGNIEVGSVTPGSLVQLNPSSLLLASPDWAFRYAPNQTFQDITLNQGAAIDATGFGGGSIQVQGRQVKVLNASFITSGTIGNQPGGTVLVQGSELIALNETITSNNLTGGISSWVGPNATGNASNLKVIAPRLMIQNAQIATGNIGPGRAGNVFIQADQIIVRSQETNLPKLSGIFSTVLGSSGQGGNIQVSSERISLQDGGMISTGVFGSGNSGNINLQADSLEVIGFSSLRRLGSVISTEVLSARSTGKGGEINLRVNQLTLQDGGYISASTGGIGNAGNIKIQAQTIAINEKSTRTLPNYINKSRISASSIISPFVDLQQLTQPGFALSSSVPPIGASGSIKLTADRISISQGGSISVINLSNIDQQSNIEINANHLILRQGSQITTDARGSSAGGNIRLNTQVLVALENSDITANALNSFGGQVFVNAQSILGTDFRSQLTPNSDITASSALGAEFSGTVKLATPNLNLSQALVALNEDLIDPGQKLASHCDPGDGQSQFVVTGRGGLVMSPTTPMAYKRPWHDLRNPAIAHPPTVSQSLVPTQPPLLAEATQLQRDAQGQLELTIAQSLPPNPAIATCAPASIP